MLSPHSVIPFDCGREGGGRGEGGGGRGEGEGGEGRRAEEMVGEQSKKKGLHRTYYNGNLCYMHTILPRHSCNQLINECSLMNEDLLVQKCEKRENKGLLRV